MGLMIAMIIRKYQQKDRKAVEFIQLSTYFLGKPIQDVVDTPDEMSKEIKYYLEQEPESCYVAEDKGKVVGYLLGCLDDKNHEENISSFLGTIALKFFQIPFMKKKDRRLWWSRILMVINAVAGISEDSRFIPPKNSGHIHINLLPEARGKGVGTRLLKTFFIYAKSKGVKKIHANSWGTRLNPNNHFWMKNGFKEYLKLKTTFWKAYYPDEKIFLVCYIKRL